VSAILGERYGLIASTDIRPQAVSGNRWCLFASEHLNPPVDTFKHLGSTAAFSCPLRSKGYASHEIGKALATGGIKLTVGVIVSHWFWQSHYGSAVAVRRTNLRWAA
jgi:hypothetical protein